MNSERRLRYDDMVFVTYRITERRQETPANRAPEGSWGSLTFIPLQC